MSDDENLPIPENNGPQSQKRKSRLTSDVVGGMDLGGGGAVQPAAPDSSTGGGSGAPPAAGVTRDSRRNSLGGGGSSPSPAPAPSSSAPKPQQPSASPRRTQQPAAIPPLAIAAVVGIIILGVVAFAFFSQSPKSSDGSAPAPDQPPSFPQILTGQPETLSAKQVFERTKPSVVKLAVETLKPVLVKQEGGLAIGVKQQGGIGSGFFVQPDVVATNCHVVGKPKDLELLKGGVGKITGKPGLHPIQQILWKDSDRDLALIYIPGTDAKPLRLGDCTKLQVGDQIYAIGSPIGMEGTITPGIISHDSWRTFKGVPWLQHSAPIDHGNSGGPLLNSHGEVVGINTLKIGEGAIYFAVPAFEIQKALDNPEVKEKLAIIQKQQRDGFFVEK